MMNNTNFDEVPFEPAEYGRVCVRKHDGNVYIVTSDYAIGIAPEDAKNLGLKLLGV